MAGYDRYKLALFVEYKEYTLQKPQSEHTLFFKGGNKNNKNPDQFKTLPSPQSFKVSL